jgi:serine/threonine protein kinase
MPEKKPPGSSAVAPTFHRVKGGPDAAPFRGKAPMAGADDLVGTMLSERYMIMEKIGQGGMGNVYLGQDSRLGKKVAIKVLPTYFVDAPEISRRFVQEAKVAPRIDHENIIDVTDLGTTPDGVPFFVMEYLKGADLSVSLYNEGPMKWGEKTRDVFLQMCRALGAAHEKGIIHRDMKPENVFLVDRSDNRAFIKIFDFGIAKLIAQAREEEAVPARPPEDGGRVSRNTNAGVVMGTPHYMAPEQARGEAVDHRVDIYAMGAIMYEMLSGHVPFELAEKEGPLADAHRILDMQKNMQPVPMSEKYPSIGIPPEVEAVVMKALVKDPAARFQSIKDMEDAIAACAYEPDEQPPQSSTALPAVPRAVRPASLSLRGYHEIRKMEAARRSRVVRLAFAGALIVAAAVATGALVRAHELAHEHGSGGIEMPDVRKHGPSQPGGKD